MKIYTKTGDKGETGLLGGRRVGKNCVEMQVLGELDELNAAFGVVTAQLSSPPFQGGVGVVAEDSSRQVNRRQTLSSLPPSPNDWYRPVGQVGKGEMTLIEFLQSIQRDLFKIGAELASLQTVLSPTSATPSSLPLGKREISLSPSAREGVGGVGVKIGDSRVKEIEKIIDKFWSELPELKNFILPGGSAAGAHLHLARAVCRRAERQLVDFAKITTIRPELNMYLNRLSDFLFAAARWVNFKSGEEEIKV